MAQFDLYSEGRLLHESGTLDSCGVKLDDVLMIGPRQAVPLPTQAQTQPTQQSQPDTGNAGILRGILSRVTQRASQPTQHRPAKYEDPLFFPLTFDSVPDPGVFRSHVMSNPDLLNQLLNVRSFLSPTYSRRMTES